MSVLRGPDAVAGLALAMYRDDPAKAWFEVGDPTFVDDTRAALAAVGLALGQDEDDPVRYWVRPIEATQLVEPPADTPLPGS